jgi:shikimate 5-dehydrogenase
MKAVGGFTMLLEQALATFEAWFGFRPQLDAAARTRLERLAA